MALKKFNDGDVFYSEDMDSLVTGSNMRFSDAATRDAVLVNELAPGPAAQVTLASDLRSYRRSGAQWLPMPGTVCFSYAKTSAQTVAASAMGIIGQWNQSLIGRNYGNWFDASLGYFKPNIFGYFELCAGVVFDQPSAYTGIRNIFFYDSYTSGYSTNPSQGHVYSSYFGASGSYIFLHSTAVIQWNGVSTTGSGLAVAVQNGYSGGLNITPVASVPSYFSAKFLGQ
jgi:hypothetical protein